MAAAGASRGFVVTAVPPFRLDRTVWALRRRPRNAIDRWDGTIYRRVLSLGEKSVEVSVRQSGSMTEPRLIVNTTPALSNPTHRRHVRRALGRLLGLHIDLSGWYRVAARDERLASLATRFRGVKPPRFATLFEAVINAFACQQLSLEVGLELLNRLAVRCGDSVDGGGGAQYAFPGPSEIAALRPSQVRALGFSGQKVRAIEELARAIAQGHLDLEQLDDRSDELARQQLSTLRGVGRWTVEYVLLRGFGRLGVFPGDDVGAQKKLAAWLRRRRPLDYAEVRHIVERWHPYAGMVYFHLLLDGLAQRGIL